MSKRPWTSLELRRAVEWYAQGISHAEIGSRLGRPRRGVMNSLHKAGVVRYKRADLARHATRIRQLHARGHTDAEIARRIGLARKTVHGWRTRMGLPANPMPRKVTRRRYLSFLRNHEAKSFAEVRWIKARIARLLSGRAG